LKPEKTNAILTGNPVAVLPHMLFDDARLNPEYESLVLQRYPAYQNLKEQAVEEKYQTDP